MFLPREVADDVVKERDDMRILLFTDNNNMYKLKLFKLLSLHEIYIFNI
jgi:hypothetical protein